jgi:hypothetical protein
VVTQPIVFLVASAPFSEHGKIPMRISHLLSILLIALCSLTARPAAAGQDDQGLLLDEATCFFQQASQLQDQAQRAELYRKALVRFEKLVQEGAENGKLYYNLGNTYFQLHDLGRAVLNYRRAQMYLPNDDNIRQNLLSARAKLPDRIEPGQEVKIAKNLLFWHYDLSARVRLILLAVANFCFWGGLALRLYRRRGLWWPVMLALALMVMMGGSLFYERYGRHPAGVLVAEETTARKGDGQAYAPSFSAPLHAGLDFSLVEKRGEWLYIELPDGRLCWIPAESAELI